MLGLAFQVRSKWDATRPFAGDDKAQAETIASPPSSERAGWRNLHVLGVGMIFLALVLAGQVLEGPAVGVAPPVPTDAGGQPEPSPPGGGPVRDAPPTSVTVFERTDKGAGACAFDPTPSDRAWRCGEEQLKRNRLRQETFVVPPTGLRAAARIIPPEVDFEAACLAVDVEVALQNDDVEATIDWERATLIVNSRALPAVPGFAARATSSLSQRKVRVPAGTSYLETVQSAGGDCLVPPPKPGEVSRLALELPVQVGGVEQTIRVSSESSWLPISERDAFSLVPRPMNEEVKADPGVETNFYSSVGYSTGLSLGLLLGGATMVNYGLENQEREGAGAWLTAVASGAVTGICVGGLLGGCCSLPGFAADYMVNRNKPQLQEQWAWQRKRLELGLDKQGPQAH